MSVLLLTAIVGLQAATEDPAAAARRVPMPELRAADLPRWREHLRPSGDELAFERIPWIADFAEGVRRADAEGRPLLFWAMNGHPLGCT